jgi:tRNA threonylcarbamoyladenosine biosynthesis protein TsaB
MTQAGDCTDSKVAGAIVAFDRVLILETSGRIGRVGLATGDHVVAEERLAEARRRASDLALVVDRLLKGQGWKARDFTAVIVGLGPGSYTGLRVGLASAKALAYATGCQFFGVETFAAIALRAPADIQQVSVVGDALQGKLFRRGYRRVESAWDSVGPLEEVRAAEWLASLHAGVFVTGPAAGMFSGKTPPGVVIANDLERDPRPVDLLNVAQQLPWAVTTDVWRAEPLYVRGSSAEEKAAGRT